jgi:hypothetical protein
MDNHEIERQLRLPAPDEPAVLPALVLPPGNPGGALVGSGVRFRAGEAPGRGVGFASPRLVLAILALLAALVGAIATGALRPDRLPNPFDQNSSFGGGGIQIEYPDDWVRLMPAGPASDGGGPVSLIVSSVGVSGCSESDLPIDNPPTAVPSGAPVESPSDAEPYLPPEFRMLECVASKPMAPGETRLVLTHGFPQWLGSEPVDDFDPAVWFGADAGTGFNEFYVPTAADGWTEVIDGMPAKLVVTEPAGTIGADEVRTWAVYQPGRIDLPWVIRLTLRGPDLEALRGQGDAIARSVSFNERPPALDEARLSEALRRVIDRTDRETRTWQGSDFYGCFPRTPGEQDAMLEDVLFEYGPSGPLAEPVPVTCRTTVEWTPLLAWHATLVVSWAAGDGYPAGKWGWELFFNTSGTSLAGGQLFSPEELSSPGRRGALPPPLEGPLVIPVGSVVEVLEPGFDWNSAPMMDLWERPNATIGDHVVDEARPGVHFYVIDGPLAHNGIDWYLVERQRGTTTSPNVFGWLPSSGDGRPLMQVVEPACIAGEVAVPDLLRLIPAERLLCFGGDTISLDPVVATPAEPEDGGGSVSGSPDWLAAELRWQLYGRGGPDGVDGALRVAISPELDDSLPTNAWLTVRGHFDDPASSTCSRSFPEEWQIVRESPEVQVLRCRETFVITSFEETAAP